LLNSLTPHFIEKLPYHDFKIGWKIFYIAEILTVIKSYSDLLNEIKMFNKILPKAMKLPS
jgi:hypothetical protein